MSDNRTRIWFSLFVLAVFGGGLALGIVLGRRMAPPPRPGLFAGAGDRAGGPGRGGRGGMLLERLDRELELTAEQRQRLRGIFEARRPRLRSMQQEMAARAADERRQLQAEVREVLTPDQQVRFDRWLERQPQPRGRRGPP